MAWKNGDKALYALDPNEDLLVSVESEPDANGMVCVKVPGQPQFALHVSQLKQPSPDLETEKKSRPIKAEEAVEWRKIMARIRAQMQVADATLKVIDDEVRAGTRLPGSELQVAEEETLRSLHESLRQHMQSLNKKLGS